MRLGVPWVAARTRDPRDPSRLYAWEVEPWRRGPGVVGQGGVTDDRATAIDRVCDALEEAPAGAQGTVRRVMLSPSCRIAYLDLGVVVRARRDEATGIVMWDES